MKSIHSAQLHTTRVISLAVPEKSGDFEQVRLARRQLSHDSGSGALTKAQEGMCISMPSRSALVTRMFVAANFRSTLVRPSGSGGENSQTSTT